MKKFILLSSALILTACATVFSGSTQDIHVKVLDDQTNEVINGAKCTLSNSKGNWSFASGPNSSVSVTKGGGGLNPSCVKPGYQQSNFSMGENFNKTTLVNVLFWPGFFVDMASGAMHQYPSHMIVYMNKK